MSGADVDVLDALAKKWMSDADRLLDKVSEQEPAGYFRWAEWVRDRDTATAVAMRACGRDLLSALARCGGAA